MRNIFVFAGIFALAGCVTPQEATNVVSEPQSKSVNVPTAELKPLIEECIKVVTSDATPDQSLGKAWGASVRVPPTNLLRAKRNCMITMPNSGQSVQNTVGAIADLMGQNGFAPASNPEISSKWRRSTQPLIFSNGSDFVAVSGQSYSSLRQSQVFFNLF